MRCRDAKFWPTAQRENGLVQSDVTLLQQQVKNRSDFHEHEPYQQRIDHMVHSPTTRMFTSVSTERIMQAVERQKRITEQFEGLRNQQKTRIARMRIFTPRYATLIYLGIGFISLFLLGMLIFNTDTVINFLESFGGVIDTLVILAQYLQSGLALVLKQEWLLSAIALVLVIMMGMWLRLMRHPRET
jgi:hypothetical protein